MEIMMHLIFKTLIISVFANSVLCMQSGFASELIPNFIIRQDLSEQRYKGCVIGFYRSKVPISELEADLFQWRLNCKMRLQDAQKSFLMPKTSGFATFAVKLESNSDSAVLSLKRSSGSKDFDRKAVEVIRTATPFKRPCNDLAYLRGLLIEIGHDHCNVSLGPQK
jgi:hypothetical protein